HFCISDVVFEGILPEGFKRSAELYAGCVAGALQSDEYLKIIENTGFKDINVPKTKKIEIPDEVFEKFLTPAEQEEARKNHLGIYSVTVTASK
ncbi:MAG: arsenite S-adenosylmethyltransferase, partial [Chlorobiota bacterium]